MANRFYLAADGGGTKLLAVLYDEDRNVLACGKTHGTNQLFRPRELMLEETEALSAELIPPEVKEIEAADFSIVGDSSPLLDAVRRRCPIREVRGHGEGHVALASAGVKYGIAAQAGTGSDAFFIQPGVNTGVGGWGMTLGDEGGGYDIGLRTLRAAIWSEDGRGEKSVLPELLKEAWGLGNLWEMIERVTGNPDMRSLIASVAYITEKAAAMGDAPAISIYRQAGHELAIQVLAAVRNGGGSFIGPVIASGGAWKGSRHMFDAFREEVLAVHPGAEVRFPDFEPLVGSVILRMMEENGSGDALGQMERLRGTFAAFRYKLPHDYKEGS
jgi:N-acetylglucosamine kinase-like BadF-type ATPase